MTNNNFDPIKFEIISHKMWQILKEAGIALMQVSGSPVVTDVGEHMESFYDRDGRTALCGGGIGAHTMSGSFAIKHIIREYEENPGINEGDHFFLNDPFIASAHNADMFILSPIFYEGERIGWTAAATHTIECGGIDVGGMSPSAREKRHDGICFSGIKVVEGGKLRKDILDAIKDMTRVPDLVALDTLAKIAGCNVAASKFLKLVEYYGVDTMKRTLQDLIRISEEKARAKLKELPDGVWRGRSYIDGDFQSDRIFKVVCEMTKNGDHITFDFTGTDPQSPGSINTAKNGTILAIFSVLSTLLFHNIYWNEGLMAPVDYIMPEGSLVNPSENAATSAGVPGGAIFGCVDVLTDMTCKILAASRNHRGDASTQWRAGSGNFNLLGHNQYGHLYSTMVTDGMAGGTGAGVDRDGCDTGGYIIHPQTIIANVETYERAYPLRWLFRKQATDTCGHGKFRGGLGGQMALVTHDAKEPQRVSSVGRGKEPALPQGVFGGYPANSSWVIMVKEADLAESISKGKPDPQPQELSGKINYLPMKDVRVLEPTDVHYHVWEGGGGYGDPLDRDAALVARDVMHQRVSTSCAKQIYGVVLDSATNKFDEDATRHRRQQIRQDRLNSPETQKPKKAPSGLPNKRPPGDGVRMTEYLEIIGDSVHCMKCGGFVAPADQNYKEFLPYRERPLTVAGAWRPPTERFVLREFYCPGCGCMLQVETAQPDEPFLWDVSIQVG